MRIIRDRARSVDLDEFLSRPLFAYLGTCCDAGPRVSPVWFVWEDGAVWIIGSQETDTFPARIERDPRCSLAFVDFDRLGGLVHHVGMRGRASVERYDRERARRILARYLGDNVDVWDPRFRDSMTDVSNVLIRFEPETAVARDQSYLSSVASDQQA